MSEETEEKSGGGQLVSIVSFLVIVAIWTGINHWRQSSSLTSDCKDMQLGAEFCSCFSGKMMSEVGIQGSLPIVGQFFKGDDVWEQAQITSMESCSADLPDVEAEAEAAG